MRERQEGLPGVDWATKTTGSWDRIELGQIGEVGVAPFQLQSPSTETYMSTSSIGIKKIQIRVEEFICELLCCKDSLLKEQLCATKRSSVFRFMS